MLHVLSLDNLRAHTWSHECSSTSCPGFEVLQGLLVRHSHLPQVYEALAALLLERKASHTTEENVSIGYFMSHCQYITHHDALIMCDLQVSLDDALQSMIDSQADAPAQHLCVEAATILLELVKAIITQVRV